MALCGIIGAMMDEPIPFSGVEYLPSSDDFLLVMLLLYLQHHNYEENTTDLAQWTADLMQFLLDPDAFLKREEDKVVVENIEKMLQGGNSNDDIV